MTAERTAQSPGPWKLHFQRLDRAEIPRRARHPHREVFASLNANLEVMEHYPSTLDRAASDEFVDRIEAAFEERGFGLWALEVSGVAPFVGYVGLSVPSFVAHFTPAVEVGWRLDRPYWGRGYATEAARSALAFGFQRVGLSEIVSFTG